VGDTQRRPETSIFRQHAKGAHEVGIEPAAVALFGDVERLLFVAIVPEEFDDLRETDHASKQRNIGAAQSNRLATTVPVFIHRSDGGGGGIRETQATRHLCTAIAADLKQLSTSAWTGGGDSRKMREALPGRCA